MERILVSACLLGERVRYDGQAARWEPPQVWQTWQAEGRLLPFCAECAAGFPVSRPSAERRGERVVEVSGTDVTEPFAKGARLTLAFAQSHGIQIAVPKETSPSCGVNAIYDGSFSGKKVTGEGVVARLLRQHGIQVFSEHELEQARQALECL